MDWLVYLEQEEYSQTKQDYYLAQIAAEVRRTLVKSPRSVKLKDFLLEFRRKGQMTEKAVKSKQVWLTALNIKT